MGRVASDATLLRRARSDLLRWKKRWESTMTERNHFMTRAIAAEKEAIEWRQRFDTLLAATKEVRLAPQHS